MLSSEKCVSYSPDAMVGSFMAARADPQAFPLTAAMKLSVGMLFAFAMARDSLSAWTVDAEMRLVATLMTVALPALPTGMISFEVISRMLRYCLMRLSSPPA